MAGRASAVRHRPTQQLAALTAAPVGPARTEDDTVQVALTDPVPRNIRPIFEKKVTAMELKLGLKASAEQFGPRQLVELAVSAEERGMDSALVSDRFQPWRYVGGHAPFSLAWMAAVGERTTRISLGTSVLTPTFRYNPAVIAQAFATLGCLYPGRVMLGVGTGEALNEIAPGYRGDWPPFKDRFARLRESVRLMRQLWLGGRVDFDGQYYRTRGASIYDVPTGGVPIYIAAGGPVVAKYAGGAGEGFICTSGKGVELYTDQLIPAVEDGAAQAGRDPRDIDRMIEIKISYDTDHELAMENTRFWAPLSLGAEQKTSIHDPIEMEKAADELPMDQVAKRWIVSSDPDEATEKVGQYLEYGFNHLVFHAPGHDQRRFLELFERDLAPRLRRLA
jgi:coenzyme F420-dependent glucose-6-phosphate dehydrogenase